MFNMFYIILFFLAGFVIGDEINIKLMSGPPDACDDVLRPRIIGATPVDISSPNYPNPYPSNARCEWQVTTSSPFHVISFSAFELQYCSGCFCDSFDIYDGPDANAPLLDHICSDDPNNLPNAVVTTQQVVYLVFVSDSSVKTQTGFQIRVAGPAACETGAIYPEKIYDPVGWISSPNYPLDYEYDQDCAWTITAPSDQRIQVFFPQRVAFEEVCYADYVDIYDGGSTSESTPRFGRYFHRDQPPIITSTSPVLTVHFISDNFENRAGFNLTWTFVDASAYVSSSLLPVEHGFSVNH